MFKITVVASRLEWEDFFFGIFCVFLLMAILLIASATVINNLVARKLWQPFFHNLSMIKSFSVRNDKLSALKSCGISEFDELKEVMEKLQGRVRNEYETLKEFSENASHEFQTPVAVIQAKLDRLSQHTALDREMAEIIDSAQLSVNRLSRLNKNLLLIAKLGNRQFSKEDELDITDLLQKQLLQTSDLFEAKEIHQMLKLESNVRKRGNEALCEILISNLLSNALHYTPAKGVVNISLSFNDLLVSNSGPPLSFPATDLFQRFKKGENGNGANGLGLSIAKEIADFLHWGLSYIYEEQQHVFKIRM